MTRCTPLSLTLALALGCSAAPPTAEPAAQPTVPSDTLTAAEASDLVPQGYGTLHQDEITVTLRQGPLLIKATPLAEEVIRLTAPDTYTRLHSLAERRREEASLQTPGRGVPSLWLVSLFSYEPEVSFQPEDLRLQQQGRLMRPNAILPLGSGWGRQRLQQQEQQSAVYAFEERVDLDQPLTVLYGQQRSDAWEGIIPRLEVEEAKVRSRAGTPGP